MHSKDTAKKEQLLITLKCFFGFEEVLADELRELGYNDPEILNRAVRISGTWQDVYRLNLYIRCAIAVLVEIERFYIQSEEEYKKRKGRVMDDGSKPNIPSSEEIHSMYNKVDNYQLKCKYGENIHKIFN
jgi:hypothetical protein